MDNVVQLPSRLNYSFGRLAYQPAEALHLWWFHFERSFFVFNSKWHKIKFKKQKTNPLMTDPPKNVLKVHISLFSHVIINTIL